MTIKRESRAGGGTRMRLDGPVTLMEAPELRQALLEAVRAGGALELALDGVDEIDTAGLQLMLACGRSCAAAGVSFAITDSDEQVWAQLIRRAGISERPGGGL